MLLAGATAVGVGTATFADPRATLRIVDEMRDWCAAQRRRAASRPDRRTAMTTDGSASHDVRRTGSRSRSTFPISTSAEQLAKEVAPWFGVAKVGLELYSAAGPGGDRRACGRSTSQVFSDLKLHDIPTTVGRARGCSAGSVSRT